MEEPGPRQTIILTLKQKYIISNYLKKFQAGITNNKETHSISLRYDEEAGEAFTRWLLWVP